MPYGEKPCKTCLCHVKTKTNKNCDNQTDSSLRYYTRQISDTFSNLYVCE